VLVSVAEMGLCEQQIVGFSFLIHFAQWCLLMWEFIALMVSDNLDKYVVIPII
jgi:hypothetical protein